LISSMASAWEARASEETNRGSGGGVALGGVDAVARSLAPTLARGTLASDGGFDRRRREVEDNARVSVNDAA
jgi:hypothetical protein